MNEIEAGHPFPQDMATPTNRIRAGALIAWAIALLMVSHGCSKSPVVQNDNSVQDTDVSLSASYIFTKMVHKYRNADHYSDKAVLYMSYRLNGRPIQEPQPWAVSLGPSGSFAADLFNSQIRCDGHLLSCYVYDIGSGNLDSQRLVLPVNKDLPITRLYADPIANHFIAGFSEMPLDTSKPQEETRQIPPTIGLLTGQMAPAWLRPDVQLERFEDSEIDGRDCFVIRCRQPGEAARDVELWIDKESSTIWQATMPQDCLEKKVRTSPDVTDLRIVARFHQATFTTVSPLENFELKSRADATPVHKFVKIPESLPSELIGEKAPNFNLLTQSGKSLETEHFKDKTTTLMWIAGNENTDSIYDLDKIALELPGERQNYGVVYSEPHRASYETDVHAMNMKLHEVARNTKMPFYYDQDMATSLLFRIKSLPCLVVLDKNLRVQFARTIEGDWANDTRAAIDRIIAGDNIAEEMLSEYRQFLETYHQQLLAQSAASLLGDRDPARLATSTNNSLSSRLNSRRTWTNSQLSCPGNICVAKHIGSGTVFVMDGWRTVVQLDSQGRLVNRFELDLPDDTGVSVVRIAKNLGGDARFCAFMPHDRFIYLFDRYWNPIATVPRQSKTAILDAQFSESDEVLIAFSGDQGIHKMNFVSGENIQIAPQIAHSLASQNQYAIVEGKLMDIETKRNLAALDSWKLDRVVEFGEHLCCLGTSDDGDWFAIGVNKKNGSVVWSASIGPQDFEDFLQPVSSCESGRARWAVANSNGTIHLFSKDGIWLGEFKTNDAITGFALVSENGSQSLLVASTSGVTHWDLKFTEPATIPASHHESD